MSGKLLIPILICTALAGCSAARVVADSAQRFAEGEVVDGLISLAGAPIALAADIEHSPFLAEDEEETPLALTAEAPPPHTPSADTSNPIPDSLEEMAELYDPNRALTHAADDSTDPYALNTAATGYQPGAVEDDPYALIPAPTPSPATQPTEISGPADSLDPATVQRCHAILSDPRHAEGTLPVPDRYFLNSVCQPI